MISKIGARIGMHNLDISVKVAINTLWSKNDSITLVVSWALGCCYINPEHKVSLGSTGGCG